MRIADLTSICRLKAWTTTNGIYSIDPAVAMRRIAFFTNVPWASPTAKVAMRLRRRKMGCLR
jgi:hypothetical protein